MANSYLTRTPGSAGNTKKFTISAWVKRSYLGSNTSTIFSSWSADSIAGHFAFRFDGSDRLDLSTWSVNLLTTNRFFKDTNAWYHIVCAVDTDESTANNRVRFYVNGVEETSFSARNNPSSGQTFSVNNTNSQTVGLNNYSSAAGNMDGYMSHVAMVDGQQLTPATFGETDSTSGIWKFKSPSGVTWGTNGFHLKFENSGNLGLDSSGQTNNFTTNGNLRQAVDTPSNVYATMNPLDNYYAASTFTEGNNTVEHGQSPWTYNTSTLKIPEATKFYCEGKVIAMNQNTCGIATNVTTGDGGSNTALPNITGGVGFRGNQGDVLKATSTQSGTWATFTTNDIIQIACDTVNNKLYFGKNGTWLNSGDPTSGASGTGAVSIWQWIFWYYSYNFCRFKW